jgi:hypothetical protein
MTVPTAVHMCWTYHSACPSHRFDACSAEERLNKRNKAHRERQRQVVERIGGHSRIRTYDFHRVKVALYR